jgi:hypothetical protein
MMAFCWSFGLMAETTYTLAGVWIVGNLDRVFVQKDRLNALSLFGALMVVAGSALGSAPRTVVDSQPAAEH